MLKNLEHVSSLQILQYNITGHQLSLVKLDQLKKNSYTADQPRKITRLFIWGKNKSSILKSHSVSIHPLDDQKAPIKSLQNFRCEWAGMTTSN